MATVEEIHGNHHDFQEGDVFTADYVPAGYEDAPGMPWTVKVQVEEFNDEEAAYGWKIIDGIVDELMDDIGYGFGFDEFHNVRCFKQGGVMEDPFNLEALDQIDPGFWYILDEPIGKETSDAKLEEVLNSEIWGPYETEEDAKASEHYAPSKGVMIGADF